MEDVRVPPPLSCQELIAQIGSTFHASLPAGPVVLSLVAAAPVGGDLSVHEIALTWRGPRQPRLPDTVVLHHPILPPLTVTWQNAVLDPKHILYSTVLTW